jgi:hypothetical protein
LKARYFPFDRSCQPKNTNPQSLTQRCQKES